MNRLPVSLEWPPRSGHTDPEALGAKARGLVGLPGAWTPRFFVASVDLSEIRAAGIVPEADEIRAGLRLSDDVFAALGNLLGESPSGIIVRSSADIETLDARGAFISVTATEDEDAIGAIASVVEHAAGQDAMRDQMTLPLLVQTYVPPRASGHLANVRRVSRGRREWLLETQTTNSEDDVQVRRLRATAGADFVPAPLHCSSSNDLVDTLRTVARFFSRHTPRFHCEWVWDGESVYLVQADPEVSKRTRAPGSSKVRGLRRIDARDLGTFQPSNAARQSWQKIECVQTFAALGLPYGDVYVLDDPSVIRALIDGEVAPALHDDLERLTSAPAVIRTDAVSNSSLGDFLLPRTDAHLDTSGAESFLVETAEHCSKAGLGEEEIAFIAHRFIPAQASAWSLAAPHHASIRIDGTWGLPDGLLYYAHDSFEVETNGAVLERRLRCKSRIVDFDNTGHFYDRPAGAPWDWKPSLEDDELSAIAEMSGKLADHCGKPIETMFFVGIPSTAGRYPILPWFYTFDIAQTTPTDRRTESHFGGATYIVRQWEDLKHFGDRALEAQAWAQRAGLRLEPAVDLLRDDSFLEEVARLAGQTGCHVELAGSVLTHAYYVLERNGVPVRVVDPFQERGERIEFGKLVRDKVPTAIRNRGEVAKTVEIAQEDLPAILASKLIEEVLEVRGSKDRQDLVSELGDLVEVAERLAEVNGSSLAEVMKQKEKKRRERGGFDEGVLLLETRLPSVAEVARPEPPGGDAGLFEEAPINPGLRIRRRGRRRDGEPKVRVTLPLVTWLKGDVDADVFQLDPTQSMEIRYHPDRIEIVLHEDSAEVQNPNQLQLNLE